MLEKHFKFAVEDIQKINLSDYEDSEFAVAKMGFLSSRPNAHKLDITEDVLRENAPSVLNKWLVADMTNIVDAGTHTKNQSIVGRIPSEQEVEFVYDNDGYLKSYVDVVISKIYASDFCKIFENDNHRAVSVEMNVWCNEEDENLVEKFNIVGVTVLGHDIRPSCPESEIEIIRFSQEEVDKFFAKIHNNSLTVLEKFVKERKEFMAENKTYKIDKSKKAMVTTPWSDVDKTTLRNKIIDASNASTLVKSVYLKVDADWEEAPSENLHYPVMQIKGDTLVYNRNALSNALARAVQNNEDSVVNKIKKIYKDLGIDEEGKEEDAKMSKEIEFSAVDIGDIWCKVWDAVYNKFDYRYCIEGIYEQDNKKFAVLTDKNGTLYRLDFSYTEDGLTISDTIVGVKKEFIETDTILKFAEPEDVEKYRTFEDIEPKQMSAEEMMSELEKLRADIEQRDNIIMEKDVELEELRKFKKDVEDTQKVMSVEETMSEVQEYLNDESAKAFREEGMGCKLSELDAWKNKVKAVSFEAMKGTKKPKKDDGIMRFSATIIDQSTKQGTVWDRLKSLK